MLTFSSLSLRRGTRLLIEAASFTIHRGEKVGIVGANGCGKTSLMSLVRGDLQPDAGKFDMPSQLVVAHVAQELEATERPAIEFVMDGDAELRATEAAIARAEAANAGAALGDLHARYAALGGYDARSRAGKLMHGLGFSVADETQPVAAFSGGWRVRLNLAQALMCRSDLLLLDEPTNHLDLEMRQALAVALQDYAGAVVLVSHDRHLLRAVADELLLVDRGRVVPFDGDLEDYAKWFTTSEAEAEQPSGTNLSAEQRRLRKREEAERRNRLSPLRAQVGQLEARLAQIEARSREIEAELAAPELYRESSKRKLQELLQEQVELKNERSAAEAEWLTASERLEEFCRDP